MLSSRYAKKSCQGTSWQIIWPPVFYPVCICLSCLYLFILFVSWSTRKNLKSGLHFRNGLTSMTSMSLSAAPWRDFSYGQVLPCRPGLCSPLLQKNYLKGLWHEIRFGWKWYHWKALKEYTSHWTFKKFINFFLILKINFKVFKCFMQNSCL
jgi:hypothetical protein